jgi:hypothetical protein
MPFSRANLLPVLATLAACCGASLTTLAQDANSPPATMDDLVARLGADEYAQREAAENQLSIRTLPEILKALGDRGLSAEQRERLQRAGLALFRDAERAALGVQFSQFNFVRGGPPGGGVTIDRTIGGFDSARVFQAGDILRSMAGQPIRDQNEARPVIVSFEPGEEVEVEFVRGGELMRATVRLGSFRTLTNRGDLSGTHLQRAWEYRLARAAGGPTPQTPQPAMDAARYRRAVSQERRASEEAARDAAGRAQAGQLPDTGSLRGLNVVRGGTARALTEDARTPFESGQTSLRLTNKGVNHAADATRERIRQLEAQLRDNQLRIRNANLDDASRARLEANSRQLRELIQSNRADLRKEQAERDGKLEDGADVLDEPQDGADLDPEKK